MRLCTVSLLAVVVLSLILSITSCEAPKSDEQLVRQVVEGYLSAIKEGDITKAQSFLVAEESDVITYSQGLYIVDVPRLYETWEYELGTIEVEDDCAVANFHLVTKGKLGTDLGIDEGMKRYTIYAQKEDGVWKLSQKEVKKPQKE